ncbi:hypothetical protein J3F84DRAFT_222498 [Trichoderma pleuroticola]
MVANALVAKQGCTSVWGHGGADGEEPASTATDDGRALSWVRGRPYWTRTYSNPRWTESMDFVSSRGTHAEGDGLGKTPCHYSDHSTTGGVFTAAILPRLELCPLGWHQHQDPRPTFGDKPKCVIACPSNIIRDHCLPPGSRHTVDTRPAMGETGTGISSRGESQNTRNTSLLSILHLSRVSSTAPRKEMATAFRDGPSQAPLIMAMPCRTQLLRMAYHPSWPFFLTRASLS